MKFATIIIVGFIGLKEVEQGKITWNMKRAQTQNGWGLEVKEYTPKCGNNYIATRQLPPYDSQSLV